MIILGIRLKNIRSYIDKSIVFPPKGITVIYGDVGTGKSTILLSIAYALFGHTRGSSNPIERYAYPRAQDLLRVGASTGFVRLLVRQGKKLILIERGLRRGYNSVNDTGGFIAVYEAVRNEDGHYSLKLLEYRNYSSRELRKRITDLLGIPEAVAKEKPIVFTNAIYVPQFGVNDIINLKETDRTLLINTAINIQRYTYARKNIEELAHGKRSVIGSKLNELYVREDTLKKQLERINIEESKKKINDLLEENKRLETEKESLEREIEKLEKELREIEERIKKLNDEKTEIHGKLKIMEDKKEMIKEEKKRIRELLSKIGVENAEEIDKKIKEINEKIKGLEDTIKEIISKKEKYEEIINELEEKRDRLISEREKINNEISLLRGKIKTIEKSIEKKRKELKNMEEAVNQGICPLCKQKIPHEHGIKLLENARKEIIDLENEMKEYQKNIEELERKSMKYNRDIMRIREEIEKYKIKKKELDNKYNKLYEELRELTSLAKDLEKTRENLQQLMKEISDLSEEIKNYDLINKEYNEKIEEIKKLEEKRELINNRIKESSNKINDLTSKISSNEAAINELKKRLEEYDQIKKEYEIVRKKRELYEKMANLLYGKRGDGIIYRLIDLIENRVRDRAYAKFRELFITYFSKLMEDHEIISVDVDREFKPVIRINIGTGSDEITQPSGGQLTSVSLAYRLALNTIARSMIPQLRNSTLILDEPTYGFSPERVEKLRELLAEISKGGAKQVIVVTHDSSLMSIGDCRIKLSLEPGRNETMIEYEECILDENTRKYVNDILYRRSFIEASISEKTIIGGFKPIIKPSNNRDDKVSRNKYSRKTRKPRNLLDYIG